ncbi:MAG: hypothetical protein ACJZ2F_04335 [Acidimicrobiales bacterium]
MVSRLFSLAFPVQARRQNPNILQQQETTSSTTAKIESSTTEPTETVEEPVVDGIQEIEWATCYAEL